MKKIETLTPEQEKAIEKYREEWLAVGRSTEPCNRQLAEESMTELYSWVGLPKPNYHWTNGITELCIAPTKIETIPEEKLEEVIIENFNNILDGIRFFYWFPFYAVGDLLAEDFNTPEQSAKIKILTNLFKSSGAFLPFDTDCFFCERPSILKTDNRGRLHSNDGPAQKYLDGTAIYYYHGIEIPERWIEDKSSITVEEIDKENNAEMRHIMIELYGEVKYLQDSGCEKVSEDDWGILYKKEVPGGITIMMVKVVDGTDKAKDYFIPVDPSAYGGLKTAKAAVASTWRYQNNSLVFKTPEEYQPLIET